MQLTLADGSVLDAPLRHRRRRSLVDRPARARPRRAARSRRVARGAPVLRRRRRRPALGDLRTRPAARLRVGVPAARAGARTSATACCAPTAAAVASSRTCGPTCSRDRSCATSSGRTRARPSRCTRGRSRRATNPHGSCNGRVLFAGDAAGRRRPDDRRGHRAGDRDRACSRRRRSRPAPTTASSCTAPSAATCASRTFLQRVLRHPLGARAAIARRRSHAVDAAQLRPLDVGGLSRARCSARPTAGTAARSRRPGAAWSPQPDTPTAVDVP